MNEAFNRDLQRQIDGALPTGHVYQLGQPGDILRAAGMADLPMELLSDRLVEKAGPNYRRRHPFELSAVENLPTALNNPIAVFKSTKNDGARIILTDLQYGGDNFVAVVRISKDPKVRKIDIEINNVVSLYPKNRITDLMSWFKSGGKLIAWVDKKKALRFVSTQSPTSIVSGDPEGFIKSVKNAIRDFENPPTSKITDSAPKVNTQG